MIYAITILFLLSLFNMCYNIIFYFKNKKNIISIRHINCKLSEIELDVTRIKIKQMIHDYNKLIIYQNILIETEDYEEAGIINREIIDLGIIINQTVQQLPQNEVAEYNEILVKQKFKI